MKKHRSQNDKLLREERAELVWEKRRLIKAHNSLADKTNPTPDDRDTITDLLNGIRDRSKRITQIKLDLGEF